MLATRDKAGWKYPSECRPGDRVGRYTLLQNLGCKRIGTRGGKTQHVVWRVRCECGNVKEICNNNFQKLRNKHGGCSQCARSRCGRPIGSGKYRLGRGQRIAEAAERLNMSKSALYNRINTGWTIEEALSFRIGEMPTRFLNDPARRRGLAMAKKMLSLRQVAEPVVSERVWRRQSLLAIKPVSVLDMFQACGGVL